MSCSISTNVEAISGVDLISEAIRGGRRLPGPWAVHLVRGETAILGMRDLLNRFAATCGQTSTLQDLPYFLSKPGLLRRTPLLMLMVRPEAQLATLRLNDLQGALLLYEYRMMGFKLRVFATNDRSGRSTLVAPAELRSALADHAARTLTGRGAHVVLISFRGESASKDSAIVSGQGSSRGRGISSIFARREREIPDYLPLQSTYDATLATIGQRTRSNMRYYRRRAEKELGCSFCPEVRMTKAEFLAFNRECMFAVPDRVAAWRYDIHLQLAEPLFMGIRDRDGRWLSLVGGRRFDASSELLWQMNREGLHPYSISLVMRAYFIEHEVQFGSRRFYIEGGSSHPIRSSFVQETVIDLAVLRRSLAALLIRKFARRFIPGDNDLAQIFSDTGLQWKSTDQPTILAPRADGHALGSS